MDIHNNQTLTIPKKNMVKYLGVHFDHLFRLNKHHLIQISKAKDTFKSNSRIFYNTNLENKAKIICYQLLVRPLLTYATPILWNTGPTIIEMMRKFERGCIRACLRAHRTPESNYKKRTKNEVIYNKANIPRIDNFMLKLTRSYFSNIEKTNNTSIKNLMETNDELTNEMMLSGYLPPEAFTHCDKIGVIQDHNNVPIIYHKKRHSTNKKINSNLEEYNYNLLTYSIAIPNRDKNDMDRLTNKYKWLHNDAKHLDELRRRTKKK